MSSSAIVAFLVDRRYIENELRQSEVGIDDSEPEFHSAMLGGEVEEPLENYSRSIL
jgi:hypothetical protein